MDLKDVLHEQLCLHRSALLLKLDGLSERDARLPRTPTGTNLLGLLKHVACCEAGYFGEVFARPFPRPMPWDAPDADPDDGLDMYAGPDEPMAEVLDFARACFDHADATITALPIDAAGEVSWWSADRRTVTLGRILVHMATEEARHAGHADILRELHDGQAGRRADDPSLAAWGGAEWQSFHDRLQRIAESFPG